MKIKTAIVFETSTDVPYKDSKPIKIVEADLQPPEKGEVLIKIKAAGLCHSDLSVVNGKRGRVLPIALGHEASGVVEVIGEGVENFEVGDHVVCTFVPSCDECEYCLNGRPALCQLGNKAGQEGTLISGKKKITYNGQEIAHHSGISAFSSHAVVSEKSIIKISKDIPFEVAAVSGCAIITGVGAALNSAKIAVGSKVGIIGLGGVGLSALLGSQVANAGEIVAIDINDTKLGIATDLGADKAFNITNEAHQKELEEQYTGKLDYAFETAGSNIAFESIYKLLKPGGTIVTTGLPDAKAQLNIPYLNLTFEEKNIKGSYIGSSVTKRDIPLYLSLYKKGKLPMNKLISDIINFEDINEGFDLLGMGTAKRIIVNMDL
ncbi:zinc-binding dehydrogenase [Peribacillus frigoritolerans]|uniref:zinc-binding dehydrogenase n=1 Tax=Peribacillus frigoritolerans TaxID=450367 RepID=UPI002280718A|nr:alcohol dehydrogenase catalytic domain-containing protein [Peribacillus frigoritolerans]MCY9002464.1 alcohol dehydrogenase catalytic domain-containing protein [Peribacillus frigoritolerans]